MIATEAGALRAGGETVIARLCDVLVVQAIRTWMSRDPAARKGWIGALHDPRIGRAISLVHREPARPWTVESLARAVALSRSAFAAASPSSSASRPWPTWRAGGCRSPGPGSARPT